MADRRRRLQRPPVLDAPPCLAQGPSCPLLLQLPFGRQGITFISQALTNTIDGALLQRAGDPAAAYAVSSESRFGHRRRAPGAPRGASHREELRGLLDEGRDSRHYRILAQYLGLILDTQPRKLLSRSNGPPRAVWPPSRHAALYLVPAGRGAVPELPDRGPRFEAFV